MAEVEREQIMPIAGGLLTLVSRVIEARAIHRVAVRIQQGQDSARHGLARDGIVNHAVGIHRHVLILHVLARRKRGDIGDHLRPGITEARLCLTLQDTAAREREANLVAVGVINANRRQAVQGIAAIGFADDAID